MLVAANIAPDLTSAYEDWWVKPEYIDAEILEIMLDKSDETKNAKTYMLSRSYVKNDPQNIGKIVDFSNAKFVGGKK